MYIRTYLHHSDAPSDSASSLAPSHEQLADFVRLLQKEKQQNNYKCHCYIVTVIAIATILCSRL